MKGLASHVIDLGGPGNDASRWGFSGLRGLASSRVGPHFDIVGFSPRGVGNAK